MNVAAAVFGVMVPVALLVCGWNVLAPEKWCWVERGIAVWGGVIATAFLFLFASAYERSVSESPSGRFLRRDASAGAADAEHEPKNEKAPLGGRIGATRQKPPRNAQRVKTAQDMPTEHIPPCQAPAKLGKPRFSEVSEENRLGVAGNVSFPAKTGCQAPAKVGKKD